MALYLVTGVAGFIGSALAGALVRQGHEVVGLDNLRTGFREKVPGGVVFVEGDCADERVYADALPQKAYDAIFHIAGQSSGEISFDDPVYDLRTNTESTLHLLRFGLAHGCSRLIYASTMSVYGSQPDAPVAEDARAVPESFYGTGKLASENYLRLYEARGMRSTSLRLFNVYGPGQNMGNLRQGMVSIFMAMMVKDKHIHIKGHPNRYRDFVYIDDVVRAFLLCLSREQSCGRILNIGGSGKIQVGDMVERLRTLSKDPVTVEYSGSTPGDLFGIHADGAMAAKHLGYEAEISLDEGLERMYAWYLEQTDAGGA
ncbi:MAG: NAD-dependent epimerase/dehydratase family protein [Desulfovibrio sp.]|jgi:UDP-glucose 4-epimerase|nr:NAD-dependent epimerase/dehydratase family protein [Desulfovibrio sp.]